MCPPGAPAETRVQRCRNTRATFRKQNDLRITAAAAVSPPPRTATHRHATTSRPVVRNRPNAYLLFRPESRSIPMRRCSRKLLLLFASHEFRRVRGSNSVINTRLRKISVVQKITNKLLRQEVITVKLKNI